MAQGSTARSPAGQQVAYLHKQLTVSTTLDSNNRLKVGTLPSGAQILAAYRAVKTAFDAAGSNTLTVGTNGSTANNIMNATEGAATTTGNTQVLRGGMLTLTADADVYAKYVQTGTAATAGTVDITVAYAVDNEGE